MAGLAFPPGFLWGAATSAHQVEGGNMNNDWWDWERRPGTPCRDVSGVAIDHYHRYRDDVALLAGVGLNTYRYSVEWSRVEPADGVFDEAALDHYRAMTDAVLEAGLTPMVTLHHFTLPRWVAARGGWLDPGTPARFARYAERVVRALADRVDWYCTINEPGIVAWGGYLGALDFPPGRTDTRSWERAIEGLVAGHRLGYQAVKNARPSARAGLANQLIEWQPDEGARPFVEWLDARTEDVFLEAARGDDFIGVQNYTRAVVRMGAWQSAALRLALRSRLLRDRILAPEIRRQALDPAPALPPGGRRTQMGYEFRPEALEASIRRTAAALPGQPIIVTEHGLATDDDSERIEFIDRGLRGLLAAMVDGAPIKGYIHWSAFDNFEWVKGYSQRFGLIGVDRATLQRTVHPSRGSSARSPGRAAWVPRHSCRADGRPTLGRQPIW